MQLQYTIITCLKEDKQKSTESCAVNRKLILFTWFLKYAKQLLENYISLAWNCIALTWILKIWFIFKKRYATQKLDVTF